MGLTETDVAKDVQTPSFTIHYNEAGPADGHPVILIHGGGPGATGWSNYNPNIEPIAAPGLRVIAPDLPGWGDSSAVDWATYDQVDAVIELLDALGIERAAFVGNSMGGHTSLRLAIEHPDRVSHLITMGAPVQMKPILFGAADGPPEGLKVMGQTWRDYGPEQMKRLVEIMVYDKARFATPELCEQRSAAIARRPEHVANVVAHAPRAPITRWLDTSRLSEIKAPTLIIQGRDDRCVSAETAVFLGVNIPDSRAHIISRCGHWAQLEHADEFNRLVVDFVQHH
ncbi:alpha/beta fold hydrolase [Nocardioides marmotae]|uniref:alpha/beta fold hydrolase n=1 Tax=Nocardioides marmotae TaxID=2663857 RepID=UPI0012B637D3|nr:alpha/beta hydrolase [Nocardioides marmotae]MBC9731596.1 alpha/beta fold hydrolase [Nocardioides marmotae]MTB82718.1 alpha/beta fold hydrolase [Nocardioides marmotae]